MSWNYSNTFLETTLTGSVTPSATTITVASTTGLPVSFPYSLIVDFEQPTAEVVTVTALAGPNLTVTRGEDGTTAQAHSLGARVVHGVVARDVREPQTHIAASGDVHGVGAGSAVVGTATAQTLTNKTISGAANTLSSIPSAAITQPFASISTGSVNATNQIDATRAVSTDIGVSTRITGDANPRLALRADGRLSWGDGTATDTVLYRSAANTLKTDDLFEASSGIKVSESAAGNIAIETWVGAETNRRFAVDADGTMAWGDGTNPVDTNLYRSAANVLKTNDTFEAAGADFHGLITLDRATAADLIVARQTADTNGRIFIRSDGRIVFGDGAGASDTNLYRSAANVLKTDDSLQVAGDLTVTGDLVVGGIGSRVVKVKTAAESVTNSTVRQNDNHLTWPVVANATYAFEINLIYSGAAGNNVGELGVAWSMPTGASVTWGVMGQAWFVASGLTGDANTQAFDLDTTNPSTQALLGTTTDPMLGILRGTLFTGASSGTFVLQWNQWVANATATTLHKGSWGALERVA